MGTVGVVIVTHNSGIFISKLMESLEGQTRRPDRVVIVDSGSSDTDYLDRARHSPLDCIVLLKSNIGFGIGCNMGWDRLQGCGFTFFLNPDAFPTPDFIERAIDYMEGKNQQNVGMLTGTLLGYDIALGCPTGSVDSTGIFQTWFGRFYDRDQGKPLSVLRQYGRLPNSVPAICGAVMFARATALKSTATGNTLFETDYFMYKEDIDMSLRMSQAGWYLIHHPDLTAYHCRGWKSRRLMPQKTRLLSARNEVRMLYKRRSPFIVFSIVKYCMVKLFNV